jgi:hypothetical protein
VVRSALIVANAAKTRWVAAIPVKALGAYTLLPAQRDHGEPAWPVDLTLQRLLRLAFPEDMRINDRKHPIARELRGE